MNNPVSMNETMFPEISISGSEKQDNQGNWHSFTSAQ